MSAKTGTIGMTTISTIGTFGISAISRMTPVCDSAPKVLFVLVQLVVLEWIEQIVEHVRVLMCEDNLNNDRKGEVCLKKTVHSFACLLGNVTFSQLAR